jgi:hypothetical protein
LELASALGLRDDAVERWHGDAGRLVRLEVVDERVEVDGAAEGVRPFVEGR